MRWQTRSLLKALAVVAVALLVLRPLPAAAQVNQNQNQNQNQNTSGVAGIAVDAQGVVETKAVVDPNGQLMRQQIQAARQSLSRDVQTFSKLRKVSLTALERTIREKNGVVTEEMKYLAGLLRVRYVFLYPESGDIVIAGPAEGWATDPAGRVVGITTGRPVVQLQDLVVALRMFPPGKKGTELISCSIDPTPEGLAAMQRFLRSIGSQATPAQTQFIVDGLRTSLGLQAVTISGVPPTTHFAQVMVEADYRMKLIGIGLERPPVKLVSFVERVNPAQVSRNALFRWFFTPDYQCVRQSEDKLAMELVGDGVKLVGEDELVSASGQRQTSGKSNRASEAFVVSFTKRYPELAERSPVYAELRNLIDLTVACAYMQKADFYGKARWKMEFFRSEKEFPVETYNAPKMVGSAVAAIWRGNRLMTPIGGGVHIEPAVAIQSENLLSDDSGEVAKLRSQTKVELRKGQWWWD
jgi:hypothetical protein